MQKSSETQSHQSCPSFTEQFHLLTFLTSGSANGRPSKEE
uniref:Nucleic acid binding protein n=1 Tax=Arundo donax TaxID=35708 RepID=A0A0A9EB30_ARUDO